MKVWCLFEESSHDDLYERDNDGIFLVGIYDSSKKAVAAMKAEFKKQDVNETDTVDRSAFSIELSKWVEVFDNVAKKTRLDHDCDWKWKVEEREVL